MYKPLKELFLQIALLCGGEAMSWHFWKGKGLILSFHGVIPDHPEYLEYPYANFIPLSTFRKQMAYLKQKCTLLPLKQMIEIIRKEKKLPPSSVAVTFDDGYKNNCDLAFPILEELSIPATFFIATGFIGKKRILPAEELKLILYYFTEARSVFLEKIKEEEKRNLPSVNNLEDWVRVAVKIYKNLPFSTAAALLKSLRVAVDAEMLEIRKKPFKFMGISDIKFIESSEITDIGAHTVNHKILSQVSETEADWEISESKKHLEEWLNNEINMFAYPNGRQGDFTSRDQKIIINANYQSACTEIPGYLTHQSEMFSLPRIDIGLGHSYTIFCSYVCGLIPTIRGWNI